MGSKLCSALLTVGFLPEEHGHQVGFDPLERGVEAFGFEDTADAGFDFIGLADCREELIGSQAGGAFAVDCAGLSEDPAAGVEGENGIADPGQA